MIAPVCPICRKILQPSRTRPRKYCSAKCADKGRRLCWNVREEMTRKHETRARLCARDEEYAKAAAPVTVDCVRTTDGRTLVVETRGRAVCGRRSSGHVSHG